MIDWNDDDLDYEEEPDEKCHMIAWLNYNPVRYRMGDTAQIFLVEEVEITKDEAIIIFCDNHRFAMVNNGQVKECLTPLSEKNAEDYIYTNKVPIWIWTKKYPNGKNYYWKDIPQYIKEKISFDKIIE